MANFKDLQNGIKQAPSSQPAMSSSNVELFMNTILENSEYDAAKLWLIFPDKKASGTGNMTSYGEGAFSAVKGFMTKEFSFSVSSDYSNPMEIDEISSLTKNFQLFQVGLKSLLSAVGEEDFFHIQEGRTLLTKEMSSHVWTSSGRPNFNIEFVLLSYRRDMDIRDTVKKLYTTVLPTSSGVQVGDLVKIEKVQKAIGNIKTLVAPLGYLPYRSKTGWRGENTVTLKIGNWFYAKDLVVTNVSSSFTKEVVKLSNGNYAPLAASVSMSLEPYQYITVDDFNAYFEVK